VRHWPPSTKHRKGVMNIRQLAKEDPLRPDYLRLWPRYSPALHFPSYVAWSASPNCRIT